MGGPLKLPKLNAAIRAAPELRICFNSTVVLDVVITKQSAIQALSEAFPDKGETGMAVTEEGYLTRDTSFP